MANPMANFMLTPGEDGYTLRIEDEAGKVVEFFTTDEQLDALSEEIDRVLDESAPFEDFDDGDEDDTDKA